jgi:serine/threonine protein kinase/WD40 repeat protein
MKRDMLKLLSCAHGHYWEKLLEDGTDQSPELCPVCGQAAETMPLLDLAPTETAPSVKGSTDGTPPLLPLRDKDGRPIVAGYEILAEMGQGPTGVHLYRARQVLINRTVVLKVVFAKDDPSQLAWGSLRGESSALGRIAHPNIVQIFESGERERQLFYNAVEHVDGPTLAEMLSGKPLPIRQALVLVETLARAVHYAHEKGILHRNLKPASILLASGACERSSKSESERSHVLLADCVPKITDFGLARRSVEGDAGDVDLQGKLPCYLAPEQAWGRAKEIGPATDVYALGAILYELISGRPPFREATPAETLDAILAREPRPLSRLRSRVPRNVEAICRKCLAKQPRRRYASAQALAEDLRRYADGQPVTARSPGTVERLGKLLRRNARGLALVLLGLVAGAVLFALLPTITPSPATLDRFREQNNRNTIDRLEGDLERTRQILVTSVYRRDLTLAEHELTFGDPARARELLAGCAAEKRNWEWNCLNRRAHGEDIAWVLDAKARVTSTDISPNGRYLVVGAANDAARDSRAVRGNVSVWDIATRQRLWQADVSNPVRSVAFYPDGARLALMSENEIQVRDTVERGSVLATLVYPRSTLTALAYLPESGRLLVAGGDGSVRVLREDRPARQLREMLSLQSFEFRRLRSSLGHAHILPLLHQSERIAYVNPEGNQVVLFPNLSSFRSPGAGVPLRFHFGTVLAIAYNEQSEILATAGRDQTICLWDVRSADRPTAILRGHHGPVTGVAFSSAGKRLASCGEDGTVRIWDTEEGLELLTLKGYDGASGVRFPSGRGYVDKIASGEADQLAVSHGSKVTLLKPR